ncbi:MAG: bifunctional diaminohydroxyphosphoribosylaminopyrimidine deaminase/5-amino-6-(5-phosphoribosylamino)uracil reductase RibD [Steroidobacteraceae bacterium]
MTASPAWTDADRLAMTRALVLAERGLFTTDPNPRVGCVLMRDGERVGEGWHERAGGPHAEAAALAMAGARARGATAYVTLDPCNHHGRTPPCSLALIEAGVVRVVSAVGDTNPEAGGGLARLAAAGVEVCSGLMMDAARALNAGFLRRMSGGLPWVRVKLAMSLDGHTALANGASRWITGEAARADVQQFRARSSAILTGAGTVLADDPRLDVRLPGTWRQPLRVVLDSALRMPPAARLLDGEGHVLVIGSAGEPQREAALRASGAQVQILPGGERPDLRAVLEHLAARGCNEVWVECGPRLASAFVAQGLFDELIVYVAPALLGGGARPLLDLPAITDLAQRWPLRFVDARSVGDDLRLTAVRG